MTPRLRLVLAAASLPLVAGCADMDYMMWRVSGEPRPGLEVQPPPLPALAPLPAVETRPTRTKPDEIPFPPAQVTRQDAERLLAGDPMALRHLALRALVGEGLVDVDAAVPRRDANLGALLPLTTPQGPGAEVELPLPPVDEVMNRFRLLDEPFAKGPRSARSAEQDFLLDQVLPARPDKRLVLAPHDKESARAVLQRLNRLEQAGLVSPEEHAKEAAAVESLMASLPEKLLPSEPPEPPKKVARSSGSTGTGSGTSARRLQGGVTGKLEVIPSPDGFDPVKLKPGYTGQAGVHLLSMASATHGPKAWEALKNQFKQELAGLSYTVQRADLGELGVTYRLIAGPMDATAAERLCGVIRQKGQACMPTPYPQETAAPSSPASAPAEPPAPPSAAPPAPPATAPPAPPAPPPAQ